MRFLQRVKARFRGDFPVDRQAGSVQVGTRSPTTSTGYEVKMQTQGEHWDSHYLDPGRPWNAWLEHPLIGEHYQQQMRIGDLHWVEYLKQHFRGPARRSLDLGCASGFRSLELYQVEASAWIEGVDVGREMVAEAERLRQEMGTPGRFWRGDVNTVQLPPQTYDLIFSCHAFHHFVGLEQIMSQVHEALTPNGLFLLEEYVGPTQFQWTDKQLALVRSLLSLLPDRLRTFRWGERKEAEVRMDPEALDAASPFEAIRSAEILPLFRKHFEIVVAQSLGGTIQHLLYNSIIHNFDPKDVEACHIIKGILAMEDALIDAGLLPADFMLLIGKAKGEASGPSTAD